MKLLQFRMDAGDEALKKHFAQMAGNVKYTSPTIQNEILGIASTMGVEELVAEANESFISVVADESCDISGKEQLSIVLRYTKGDKVNESFTRLVEMSSVSAESISAAILAHLSRIGVDLQKLVGQGYDGASTMAGHVSGVQKCIRKKYSRAIFVHCVSHCLNLVINDQSRVSIVRSICDSIKETIRFFQESPKKRSSLGVNIPLFSPTRWSQKYKSIRIFKANFKLILDALASLMEDASGETRAKALSLKAALEMPGVTYAICLIGRYSALMEPLARRLQSVGVSVPSVKSLIAFLQSVLGQDRVDFNTVASSIYDEACAVVGMKELSVPRVVGIRVYRDNAGAESASQYYQRSIFLQYIEGLSSSVRERFNDNPSFFALLSILPPNNPTNINDIESLYSLDTLVNDVKLWRSSLTAQVNQESLPELFLSAQAYPSVRNAIQIILTLPATPVEAERSFSCMRRVKTWLRSHMTSDRLSDLCVLHCHHERVDEEKTNRILATMAGEKR